MNAWFNYEASLKILVFSLLAGAALPALFAFGVRLHAAGTGEVSVDGGTPPRRNPALIAAAWVIYAVVLAVITIGVLYIARDFIAHHTGYGFLGAKPQ